MKLCHFSTKLFLTSLGKEVNGFSASFLLLAVIQYCKHRKDPGPV